MTGRYVYLFARSIINFGHVTLPLQCWLQCPPCILATLEVIGMTVALMAASTARFRMMLTMMIACASAASAASRSCRHTLCILFTSFGCESIMAQAHHMYVAGRSMPCGGGPWTTAAAAVPLPAATGWMSWRSIAFKWRCSWHVAHAPQQQCVQQSAPPILDFLGCAQYALRCI